MKSQFLKLLFAMALLSTCAFADNPSDAPLAPSDVPVAVQKQNNCATRSQANKDVKRERQSCEKQCADGASASR